MNEKYTESQLNAINDKGETILVSASAGSGKTSVLTERVVKKIIDINNPTPANKILMATFTKASANEMKERIKRKISQEISKSSDNYHLIKQQSLLEEAFIGTISSFCFKFLRENSNLLNLNSNFTVCDENLEHILKTEAIEEVLKDNIEKENVLYLLSFLGVKKDYKNVFNLFYKLIYFFEGIAFEEKFINDSLTSYKNSDFWIKFSINESLKNIIDSIDLLNQAKSMCINYEELSPIISCLNNDLNLLNSYLNVLKTYDYKNIYNFLHENSFLRFPTIKKMELNDIKNDVKLIRDKAKSIFEKEKKEIYIYNKDEIKNQINISKNIINTIFLLYKDIDKLFLEKLLNKNKLTYSKIEKLSLNLLCEYNGQTVKPTSLANTISENYDFIFIDEYQDNNLIQDYIFKSISKNEKNLFFVGDLKQSIYSFRKSTPKLFLDKLNSYNEYNNKDYPSKILFLENFRSSEKITDFINFLFNQIMTQELGGIDYDKTHELISKAKLIDNFNYGIDFFVINKDETDNKFEKEAECIAFTIKKMIDSKMKINYKGSLKDIEESDFCILLRSNKDIIYYTKALKKYNLNYSCNDENNLFDKEEIITLISILKTINNPTNEIDLTACLLSGLFNFTIEDITKIKLENKNKNLYELLLKSKEPKVIDFLNNINLLKKQASIKTVKNFIIDFIKITKYDKLQEFNSNNAYNNINLFIHLVEQYEDMGDSSLFGFLNYIEKLISKKSFIQAYSENKNNSKFVNVMTIHKSKGLEFPVVIPAGLFKSINTNFKRENFNIDSDLFLNFVLYNNDHTKEKTFGYILQNRKKEYENLSEELRILYVALTRAKEKLVFFVYNEDVEKILKEKSLINNNKKINYNILNKQNLIQIILMAILKHKDFQKFFSLEEILCLNHTSRINFELIDIDLDYELEKNNINNSEHKRLNIDLEKVLTNINYKYKYKNSSFIPNKLSVSEITKSNKLSVSKSCLFSKDTMTYAEKGIVMHKFMQLCNYENAKNDILKEAKRLFKYKFFNEKEFNNLDIKKLENLFRSNFFSYILSSNKIYREYKLMTYFSAYEIYRDIKYKNGDNILIQGIADCVLEFDDYLVLIDYKTDFVKKEKDLIDKYKDQLKIYRKALEENFQKKVKISYIYSFFLSKEIEVKI